MAGWWRAGVGCLMVLAAILLLLLVPVAHEGEGASSAGATPLARLNASPSPAPEFRVRYYGHGDPSNVHVQISYVDQLGGVRQVPEFQGPWDVVLPMRAGRLAQVTVRQAPGNSDNQSLTCEIQINGKPWKQQTAQGKSAQVTCEGVVGQP